MTIEQAITKAVEGGWEPNGSELQRYTLFNRISHVSPLSLVGFNVIFLDPKFWQALGKGMGRPICEYKCVADSRAAIRKLRGKEA